MPIAPQRAPPFAGHLPGDADDPRAEPRQVAERGQLAVRPQETLLRHVLDGRPIARDADDHRADHPRVSVVELPERLAVARKRLGNQFSIARNDWFHAHPTSGRSGAVVQ